MFALTIRNIWEQTQKLSRIAEARISESSYAVSAFDLHSLPILKPQAYPGDRDVTEIDLVVGHVTDVRGGFGVQRWGPTGWQHWLRELEASRVPPEIMVQLGRAEANAITPARIAITVSNYQKDPAKTLAWAYSEIAKRIALWSRWRNTPYHQISGGNGDVVDNRRLASRTKASSAGNDGVAWAMDRHHKQPMTPDDVETGKVGLRRLVQRLREQGNKRRLRYGPHGCFDGMRWADTSAIVHREVVIPAVAEIHASDPYGFFIDYEAAKAGGRPIPRSWDPNALHDERGRRS